MQPVVCSHCGAPPAGAVTADAKGMYTCSFCGKPSYIGPTASTAPNAPNIAHNWADQVGGPDDDDDDDDEYEDEEDEEDEPPQRPPPAQVAAATARGISWIVWLVVVVAVTGGAGFGVSRCTKGSTLLSSLVWDGKEPLECSGNDKIAVTGVTASFNAGPAILAGGNCQVRCEGCTITAPTAVDASGNAQVSIVNGSATGTTYLTQASGNARVTFSGDVKVSGKVKESRAGQVSAPTPSAAASAPPAEPAKAAATASTPARAAPVAPAKASAAPKGKSPPR